MVWYFAYGRNLNVRVIRDRVGRFVHPFRGILPGYDIAFNKRPGPRPRTGYANIVPSPKKWVEGALYLLTDEELRRLDEREGVRNGHYVRVRVSVWNVDRLRWVEAETYVAVRTDDSLRPPRDYLRQIIEGAEEIGLSPEWIGRLKSFMEAAI